MHRQSLGSPASKLHNDGGSVIKEENLPVEKQKGRDTSPSLLHAADEENEKSQKPHKSPQKPERLLHVIPLLTFLCFLVLYLSSHDPSQKDLAQFSGFNWPSKTGDSNEIDGLDVERFSEVERGDMLAIRSLKNLHERERHGSEYRLHRKIADF